MNSGPTPSFRPSAYYWRKEIRACKSAPKLRTIALALVRELEEHKAELRRHGLIPPKTSATSKELREKPALLEFSIRAVE